MPEQEPCPCCEAETPAKVEITVVPYDESIPCSLPEERIAEMTARERRRLRQAAAKAAARENVRRGLTSR